MKHLKFILSICAALMLVTSCGSKSGGSGDVSSNDKSDVTFYESNGVCFRARTNERVNNSDCDDLDFELERGECVRKSDDREVGLSNCTNNTYFISNSDCYDRSGDRVDNRRCISGDAPPSTGTSGRQRVCEGPHLQFTRDDILEGDCDGVRRTGNCSGAVLFDIERQEWAECL